MPRPFTKVLIANRGEIAVRVIRTLREMGIGSVAVYSEADRAALHVRMADEAHPIGPAPASESYLRVDKIVDTARKAGAQAIHPGYGFLSENPALPEACEAAGITFIGPPASAMRRMGSKTAARKLMSEAGVPITPGALCDTAEEAAAAAKNRCPGHAQGVEPRRRQGHDPTGICRDNYTVNCSQNPNWRIAPES